MNKTIQELAAQALAESVSETTTAHHGGGPGRPFWNAESTQFLYVPSFQFAKIPGCKNYRFSATDEAGETHTFEAESPEALITPIWKTLPEGVVQLKCETLNNDGTVRALVGARTFFKLAPFPADLPPARRSYRESAIMAFDYAFSRPYIQHWLTEGTPDPGYDHNVYLTKMNCAIIDAMLEYRELRPERAEAALTIAKNAADYMIRVSEPAGSPLEGLPLTYYLDFRPREEGQDNLTADTRKDTIMMIYPPFAGRSYLRLEKATGDPAYLRAAEKIGTYYRDHVLENGSWPVFCSRSTGEACRPAFLNESARASVRDNSCAPLQMIVPFLSELSERLGDPVYQKLAENAVRYTEKEMLPAYDWEAQFEDSWMNANYSNLSHYPAEEMMRYYVRNRADDPACMAAAEDLLRFVEDQFLVWHRAAPWDLNGYSPELWRLPAGLEQYAWYVPIDCSTAHIMMSFLIMHEADGDELKLAKARALADQLTRVQQDSGLIATHWMNDAHVSGDENFWLNCMLETADSLLQIGNYLKDHGITE